MTKEALEEGNKISGDLENLKSLIIPARGIEYYPETKDLLLLRCPKCGKENYAPNVAKGICTWCGYDAHELIKEDEK